MELKDILGSGKPQIRDFKEKPIKVRIPASKLEEKPEILIQEPKMETQEPETLTEVQKVLFDFIKKKYNEGRDLTELEDMLEEVKEEGGYTLSDIVSAVNYLLRGEPTREEPKIIVHIERNKIYKEETPVIFDKNKLDDGQEMFLSFLRENSDSTYGTTDLYRRLGFSARKGNQIKNNLLKKNLIIITEQKSDKGWKKIIQLNPAIT